MIYSLAMVALLTLSMAASGDDLHLLVVMVMMSEFTMG